MRYCQIPLLEAMTVSFKNKIKGALIYASLDVSLSKSQPVNV